MITRRNFGGLVALVSLEACKTTPFRQTPKRPSKPTIKRVSPNILSVKTNGYDFNLESHLVDKKRTLVELGAYWCLPCKRIEREIKQFGPKLDLNFITIDLAWEDIESPAYRYAEQNGAKGLPFFLVYQGKRLKGSLSYNPEISFKDLIAEVQKF